MILNLLRRQASRTIVERLYLLIVAASRRPALYSPPYGVPDTVEGRFELLTVHAFMVLRRLSSLPAPAPDLAQDLVNRIFEGFDAALREMGVGDLTVPKRMKKLAGDFGGRNAAYGQALGARRALEAALARNVFGQENAAGAEPLARYMQAGAAAMDCVSFAAFESDEIPFPELEAEA